jgi:hypothetical protein
MPNDTAPTVTPPVLAPEPATTMAPLYKALVAAQRAASAVTKDAKNQHHGYKYASAEAVIEESRHALSEAGVGLTLLGWERHPILAGDHPHPRIEVRYRLFHESGVAIDLSASSYVIPGQGRPPDKAEAGALTTNLAYVLRTLLLLPREEEGTSPDTRDDREYSPNRQSRPAPRAEQAPTQRPNEASEVVDGDAALAGELVNKLDQCRSQFDLDRIRPELEKARPSLSAQQWNEDVLPAAKRAKKRVDEGTQEAIHSQKPEAHAAQPSTPTPAPEAALPADPEAAAFAAIADARTDQDLDAAAASALAAGVDKARVFAAHSDRAAKLAVAPLYAAPKFDPYAERQERATTPLPATVSQWARDGREKAAARFDALTGPKPAEPTTPRPPTSTATETPPAPPPSPRAVVPPPAAPPKGPRRTNVPF